MTRIEKRIFMVLNPYGKWLTVLSKFSEIKAMARRSGGEQWID